MIVFLPILKFFFLSIIVLILAYIAFITISFRNIVPYVPTPMKVIKRMIQKAEIKNGEKVCDLGSGSGKIVIAAAKKHKLNYIIGIEKSPILLIVSKLRLLLHPFLNKRVQILKQDFFNMRLTQFDVVLCFLTPAAMRLLTPKFKLLKKGSRIVSYMFHLEDHQGFEEKIDHVTSKDSIYVYKKL